MQRRIQPFTIALGFQQSNAYTIHDDNDKAPCNLPICLSNCSPRSRATWWRRRTCCCARCAVRHGATSQVTFPQILRRRRGFVVTVQDTDGRPVLTLRRPLFLLNSAIHVSDHNDVPIGFSCLVWCATDDRSYGVDAVEPVPPPV